MERAKRIYLKARDVPGIFWFTWATMGGLIPAAITHWGLAVADLCLYVVALIYRERQVKADREFRSAEAEKDRALELEKLTNRAKHYTIAQPVGDRIVVLQPDIHSDATSTTATQKLIAESDSSWGL